MKDIRNTIILGVIAVVAVLLAIFLGPESPEPSFFDDQGQEFFPSFTNPSGVASIEVIEFVLDAHREQFRSF